MSAVRRLKRWLKGERKKWLRRYVRARHGFGPPEFAAALGTVGLRSGDVVVVHISWDAFEAFDGKITDVLAALRESIGPEGTLLMPTMPFLGSALDWARENPTVDLRRVPSRMGLPTELFRRMPGVVRSAHPTHPVAAAGRLAAEMTADHHACGTPCGRTSPFGRLLDHEGKILLLGTGIETMTFFHAAEEILEAELPASPFTEEVFELTTIDADGVSRTTRTRLFDRALSRRRTIARMLPALRELGAWKTARVGTLEMCATDAPAALEAFRTCLRNGVSLYDD